MAIAHCTYTLGKAYRTHKARRCWSRRIESRVVMVIVVRRTLLPFDRIFTNKSSSTTFQSTNPRKGLAAGGGCTMFQSANEKGGRRSRGGLRSRPRRRSLRRQICSAAGSTSTHWFRERESNLSRNCDYGPFLFRLSLTLPTRRTSPSLWALPTC